MKNNCSNKWPLQIFSQRCMKKICINKCYIIVIGDMAYNLITNNKLRLTEMQDSSLTSMHFKIIFNLLILGDYFKLLQSVHFCPWKLIKCHNLWIDNWVRDNGVICQVKKIPPTCFFLQWSGMILTNLSCSGKLICTRSLNITTILYKICKYHSHFQLSRTKVLNGIRTFHIWKDFNEHNLFPFDINLYPIT